MTARGFYSARLLFIILVADGAGKKRNHYDESIVVFRAVSFDDAFMRALAIGKKSETEYRNDKGQVVRWALVRVINLDWVGSKIDGKEVGSVLHFRVGTKAISPRTKFHPEKSKPESSI